MPKIRGIKPDYWTDEDIVELSIPARLLFIGLWNLACDNGHVVDKPKQIKMRIMPADDVNADALLGEIEARGRITRIDGTITIKNFAKHQKPHKRWWATCDLPLCMLPDDAPPQGRNRGATVAPQGSTGGATADVDCDGDGEGDGDTLPTGEAAQSAPTPRPRGTRLPKDWIPSELARQQMARERPDIDLVAEHRKFTDHWQAKTGKDATKLDWDATWRNWIRNARGTPPPQRSQSNGLDIDAAMARARARDAQRGLTA